MKMLSTLFRIVINWARKFLVKFLERILKDVLNDLSEKIADKVVRKLQKYDHSKSTFAEKRGHKIKKQY